MKSAILAAISFLVFCLLVAFYSFTSRPDLVINAQLLFKNMGSPESDAKRAVGHGDFRCYLVNGYVPYFPGIDNENVDACNYGDAKTIYGTSDFTVGAKHIEANTAATIYSARYNKYIAVKTK